MKINSFIGLPLVLSVSGIFGVVGCTTDPDDNVGPGDSDSSPGSNDSDSTTVPEVCDEGDLTAQCVGGPVTSLRLTDEYNYEFSSDLTVASEVLRGTETLTDLTFDWSQVTHSFLDENIDPFGGIGMVLVSLWALPPDQLREKINNDSLLARERLGAICAETGGIMTSENLLDFNICMGEPVADNLVEVAGYFNGGAPGYDPTKYTHMVMIKEGTNLEGNLHAKMLKFFTVDPNATQTTISLDNTSSTLAYTAHLRSQKRIPVAVGNAAVFLNWEYLTVNSLGNEFYHPQISRLVVAHYPSTVCGLESGFLHLETSHDAWYSMTFANTTMEASLNQTVDANGAPFTGITADGTWIVALFCDGCGNPAPWFMTVLQPC